MRALVAEFDRRQPLLTRLGIAHLLLFVVLAFMMPFGDRTITGIDIWLKPAKFALSIGTYLLTMAWFLGELRLNRAIVHAVALAIALSMLTEQALITLQAARGTTSHYNFATPFDAAVFRTMGFGVALNSLAVAVALILFLHHRPGPDRVAWLWGIRLGLLIFLLGSLEGMQMIARGAHTVGLADGGPGIALLNWSTRAGGPSDRAFPRYPCAPGVADRGLVPRPRVARRAPAAWARQALGDGRCDGCLRRAHVRGVRRRDRRVTLDVRVKPGTECGHEVDSTKPCGPKGFGVPFFTKRISWSD